MTKPDWTDDRTSEQLANIIKRCRETIASCRSSMDRNIAQSVDCDPSVYLSEIRTHNKYIAQALAALGRRKRQSREQAKKDKNAMMDLVGSWIDEAP